MSARAKNEKLSPVGRTCARALAGVVGTSLGLRLAGRTSRRVGPLEVTAGLTLGRGGTEVQLPPLGSARIASHRGPLTLSALATGVDEERAQALLAAAPEKDAIVHDARRLGVAVAGRAAAVALGGAATTAAVTLRRPRDVVGATTASAALLAASAAVAAATFRRTAWRDPELHGLLTRAPLILGDLRTAPERIATYRDQLADLVATGTSVYRRVATLPEPPKDDAIRLLHISDLHLNPLAYPLARELIKTYDIDAVVDTGDLVDWGTPLEHRFADEIAGLEVPYVFVKGNHDSDAVAAAVGEQPNAVVLDAGTPPVEVAGLRFAGMADPRFTPDKTTGDDFAAHRVSEAAKEWAPRLAGQHVDIALVHDPAAARQLADTVPLVLAGHTHNRAVRRYGNTLVVVQGSSGGSGLRGVQQDPATPISLSVLYVDRRTRTLEAVDDITLGGIGAVSLNVVRRSVAELTA
jgi:predicted MPP superfamily phosphohydrolase